MRTIRTVKPAIEVGFQSGVQTATVNGQNWDGTPRVGGVGNGANGPVIAIRSGRKLVAVGYGGFHPARTTH